MPLTVGAPGLLSNTYGQNLTIQTQPLVAPEHGQVVLQADGSFVYTPVAGFIGNDAFLVQAVDGNGNYANPAVVTISVDPNLQAFNQTIIMGMNSSTKIDLTSNDSQANYTLITPPQHDSVPFVSYLPYTPTYNFVGTDSLTFQATDANGATSTATVTIIVTDGATSTPAGQAQQIVVRNVIPPESDNVISTDVDPEDWPLDAASATANVARTQVSGPDLPGLYEFKLLDAAGTGGTAAAQVTGAGWNVTCWREDTPTPTDVTAALLAGTLAVDPAATYRLQVSAAAPTLTACSVAITFTPNPAAGAAPSSIQTTTQFQQVAGVQWSHDNVHWNPVAGAIAATQFEVLQLRAVPWNPALGWPVHPQAWPVWQIADQPAGRNLLYGGQVGLHLPLTTPATQTVTVHGGNTTSFQIQVTVPPQY